MNITWTAVGLWLAHCALGGGALLFLGLTAMSWVRQPARRQRLAEWSLVAALILATLALGPAWLFLPWSLPGPAASSAPVAAPPVTTSVVPSREFVAPAQAVELTPDFAPWVVVEAPTSDGTALAAAPAAASEAKAPPEPSPADAETTVQPAGFENNTGTFDLKWLCLAYALGAAVVLGRRCVGHLVLWRLLRTAVPAPAAVAAAFRGLAGNMSRPPRLLVSSRLRTPLSFGLWRPTVLVPAVLCRPRAADRLRWVFAHELTHLERRDAWSCLLFGLGQVVYFYLPWFWQLERQARLCQEYVADAAAVADQAGAADYAQFLLSLTKMPAVPVGAAGVSGNSSDLFWRLTMLLHDSLRVEKSCPRPWSLLAASILTAAAVVVSGLGFRAQAAEVKAGTETADSPQAEVANERLAELRAAAEPATVDKPAKTDAPKNDAPPKEKPKSATEPKTHEKYRRILEALKLLQAGEGNEATQKAVEQLRKALELAAAEVQLATAEAHAEAQARYVNTLYRLGAGRLGLHVERPGAALVDQLDLPKDQGLIVVDVRPDSPAAKARLKTNDILLEFNGKKVPNDAAGLKKLVDEVKADTPVDAVVLRKGKKETVKGISLPKVNLFVQPHIMVSLPMNVPARGGNQVITTLFRSDDRFTTRHQEGSLVITVTGKIADGKAKVADIHVQDGKPSEKYENLDKVPDRYKDKVKNLIEISEKSGVKIDIKKEKEGRLFEKLGLRLVIAKSNPQLQGQLHGGLAVVEVVPESAAAKADIRKGDILVGLHMWETLDFDNVLYVLNHSDLASFIPLRFYVVRDGTAHRGWIKDLLPTKEKGPVDKKIKTPAEEKNKESSYSFFTGFFH